MAWSLFSESQANGYTGVLAGSAVGTVHFSLVRERQGLFLLGFKGTGWQQEVSLLSKCP